MLFLLLLFIGLECVRGEIEENAGDSLVLVPHGEDPQNSKNRVVIPQGEFLWSFIETFGISVLVFWLKGKSYCFTSKSIDDILASKHIKIRGFFCLLTKNIIYDLMSITHFTESEY